VSLRSGNSTDAVRLDAVNKENMDNYFDMLKIIFDDGDQKQFITWMKVVCN